MLLKNQSGVDIMKSKQDPLWQNGQVPATHKSQQPETSSERPLEQARRQNSQSSKKSKSR